MRHCMNQRVTPAAHALAEEIKKHYCQRFRRWTRDASEAEDLCQELFLRAYKLLDRHEELHRNHRLLGVMARNVLCDWWRKQKKGRLEPLDEQREPADETVATDESLARARLWPTVRAEVERLVKRDRQRQMLLVGDEELTDVAKRLQTTAATVYQTRCKLLARLARSPRLRQLREELLCA